MPPAEKRTFLAPPRAVPPSFPEENPFAEDEDEEMASVGYRYRKWDLGDGVVLVARTEHDAVYKDPFVRHAFGGVALNELWHADGPEPEHILVFCSLRV